MTSVLLEGEDDKAVEDPLRSSFLEVYSDVGSAEDNAPGSAKVEEPQALHASSSGGKFMRICDV